MYGKELTIQLFNKESSVSVFIGVNLTPLINVSILVIIPTNQLIIEVWESSPGAWLAKGDYYHKPVAAG